MKFSVIIPAYNEENYLPNTLAAIKIALARIDSPAEIIVVDNESADKTALIAESYDAKVILEKEHNIAKVRNTGAKSAAGEVLIFVDADTLIPETLFQKIDV
ncbi:MAG: glycosyltransferase [Acidobacteria bacterium]|nr:glycosyltransferase [Acidobacteriota bacterium]